MKYYIYTITENKTKLYLIKEGENFYFSDDCKKAGVFTEEEYNNYKFNFKTYKESVKINVELSNEEIKIISDVFNSIFKNGSLNQKIMDICNKFYALNNYYSKEIKGINRNNSRIAIYEYLKQEGL